MFRPLTRALFGQKALPWRPPDVPGASAVHLLRHVFEEPVPILRQTWGPFPDRLYDSVNLHIQCAETI
jgi:hypothetical protein